MSNIPFLAIDRTGILLTSSVKSFPTVAALHLLLSSSTDTRCSRLDGIGAAHGGGRHLRTIERRLEQRRHKQEAAMVWGQASLSEAAAVKWKLAGHRLLLLDRLIATAA